MTPKTIVLSKIGNPLPPLDSQERDGQGSFGIFHYQGRILKLFNCKLSFDLELKAYELLKNSTFQPMICTHGVIDVIDDRPPQHFETADNQSKGTPPHSKALSLEPLLNDGWKRLGKLFDVDRIKTFHHQLKDNKAKQSLAPTIRDLCEFGVQFYELTLFFNANTGCIKFVDLNHSDLIAANSSCHLECLLNEDSLWE